MVRSPHVIWVSPSSDFLFRSQGEVRCHPQSVAPRLCEKGLKINILVPYKSALLPKTKIASSRLTKHQVVLSQSHPVEIIKLSKGSVSPGIFMVKMPETESAIRGAIFSKAALRLAEQINRPVDIFHLFDWGASLVPLFLEMESSKKAIFENARTFLSIKSMKEQGNFAPALMAYIGVPETLFHPEGIEFYGKFSFLKTGLLMSDAVSLVEGTRLSGALPPALNGMQGVLDAHLHKLRRWISDRSVRNFMDAYYEILSHPKPGPVLPKLVRKFHRTKSDAERIMEMWGPVPPERYHRDYLAFLVQAPRKAYAFWEHVPTHMKEYGILLEDASAGKRFLLSRGLASTADYWIDVGPDREYAVELVGWDERSVMHVLMRSRLVRTPRDWMSENTNAIFIDAHARKRIRLDWPRWKWKVHRLGASEMLAEQVIEQWASFPNPPSSWGKVPSSWTQSPTSFTNLPSSFNQVPSSFAPSSLTLVSSSWGLGSLPSSPGLKQMGKASNNPAKALMQAPRFIGSGRTPLGAGGAMSSALWRALGFRVMRPYSQVQRRLRQTPAFWKRREKVIEAAKKKNGNGGAKKSAPKKTTE